MPSKVKIADAAIRVPCNQNNFVRLWFEYLRPVHRLTPKEMDVATLFVMNWIKASEEVPDEKKINKRIFSKEAKDEICDTLGIKPSHLRTMMQQLRRKRIIVDGRLARMYIPEQIPGPGEKFRLMIIMNNAAPIGENIK